MTLNGCRRGYKFGQNVFTCDLNVALVLVSRQVCLTKVESISDSATKTPIFSALLYLCFLIVNILCTENVHFFSTSSKTCDYQKMKHFQNVNVITEPRIQLAKSTTIIIVIVDNHLFLITYKCRNNTYHFNEILNISDDVEICRT